MNMLGILHICRQLATTSSRGKVDDAAEVLVGKAPASESGRYNCTYLESGTDTTYRRPVRTEESEPSGAPQDAVAVVLPPVRVA